MNSTHTMHFFPDRKVPSLGVTVTALSSLVGSFLRAQLAVTGVGLCTRIYTFLVCPMRMLSISTVSADSTTSGKHTQACMMMLMEGDPLFSNGSTLCFLPSLALLRAVNLTMKSTLSPSISLAALNGSIEKPLPDSLVVSKVQLSCPTREAFVILKAFLRLCPMITFPKSHKCVAATISVIRMCSAILCWSPGKARSSIFSFFNSFCLAGPDPLRFLSTTTSSTSSGGLSRRSANMTSTSCTLASSSLQKVIRVISTSRACCGGALTDTVDDTVLSSSSTTGGGGTGIVNSGNIFEFPAAGGTSWPSSGGSALSSGTSRLLVATATKSAHS